MGTTVATAGSARREGRAAGAAAADVSAQWMSDCRKVEEDVALAGAPIKQ